MIKFWLWRRLMMLVRGYKSFFILDEEKDTVTHCLIYGGSEHSQTIYNAMFEDKDWQEEGFFNTKLLRRNFGDKVMSIVLWASFWFLIFQILRAVSN